MSVADSFPSSPVVLVTGGAKRLGRAFCLAFAKAGWHIICHYNSSKAEALQTQQMVQALGVQCLLVQLDLNLTDAHEQLLNTCQGQALGLPQCIVNNASVFEEDSAQTSTPAHMQAHFQTNTVLPLMLANGLAKRLQAAANTQACVIHVLDQKVHNLNPDYFSYTVSKLALERSVALQAQALAPQVRVCGLSPGLSFLSGPQTQDNFDQAARINLLKRPIDTTDIARTAVFIAENQALTGTTIQVDNGQHLVPLSRDVMFTITAPSP
jgi:NAD(P)-dependent dehydrogenase (short-subunit alcohol dehydrogenase family)